MDQGTSLWLLIPVEPCDLEDGEKNIRWSCESLGWNLRPKFLCIEITTADGSLGTQTMSLPMGVLYPLAAC